MSNSTNTRSPLSTERNLKKAQDILQNAKNELDASDALVTTTEMLYSSTLDAQEEYLKWSIQETVAACLYIGTRMEQAPYTPTEVATTFEMETTILLRRSKAVLSDVGAGIDINIGDFINPTSYVERYCDELDLDSEIKQTAKQVIEISREEGLINGKSPTGVAAAAVYNASLDGGGSVTQSDLSQVADVSEVTIRNRYQEQQEVLE